MHTSSRSSGTTTASGITERQEKCRLSGEEREELASVASVRRVHSDSQVARLVLVLLLVPTSGAELLVDKQIEAILCAVPKQWSSPLPKRRAMNKVKVHGKAHRLGSAQHRFEIKQAAAARKRPASADAA